ncbi:MAG TPA: hypothetical protein EYH03_04635, partial [Chromatiales bacterium]|nr:hypothetical protein [Chromatiales bacterium]
MSYNKTGRSDEEAILDLVSNRVEGDNLSEYVVDYLPVRTSKGDEESLAVVALARKEVVVRYLNTLARTGFEVEALEISPSAIKRAVSFSTTEKDPKTVLVINFGRTESYLTMISGRRLLFDQE